MVLYLGGILSANATAAKLVYVAGVSVTTGALAIPLVYLTTDLINELYGARATRQVVWMGFGANVVLVAMTLLAGAVRAAVEWYIKHKTKKPATAAPKKKKTPAAAEGATS